MCPEWGDTSIRGLLFQSAYTLKIQLSVLVYYKVDLIVISFKINLVSPWHGIKQQPLVSYFSVTVSIMWRLPQ